MKQQHAYRIFLLTLVALFLSACNNAWVRVDSAGIDYKDAHYQLKLPLDWVRIVNNDTLIITRDGPEIQRIEIKYRPHEKAFEKLEKGSTIEILPSELAELYIADFKAQDQNGLPSLKILNNEPASIAGNQGFQLHLQYTNAKGLEYEALVKGFTNKDGFYVLRYVAPSLHFFKRDKESYQRTLISFKAT